MAVYLNANSFVPGDTYQLSVFGKPNSDVWITVQITDLTTGVATSANSSKVGTTDSTGVWNKQGTIPNQLGQWKETFTVGGDVAGQVVFTVSPTQNAVAQTATTTTTATTNNTTVQPTTYSSAAQTNEQQSPNLSPVPDDRGANIAVVVAIAVVGFLLLKKGAS